MNPSWYNKKAKKKLILIKTGRHIYESVHCKGFRPFNFDLNSQNLF